MDFFFFFPKGKPSFGKCLKTWTKVIVSENKFVGLFLKLLNSKYTALIVFISKKGNVLCRIFNKQKID